MNEAMGVRRAALLLHTLAPADRVDMLAQFDAGQRTMLGKLLDELNTLGIPRDRDLLEQTMASLAVDGGDGENGDTDAAGLVASLQSASAQDLLRVLADESVELTARLLACAKWRWAADFMAGLDPFKRRQVQALLHDTAPSSPHFNKALLRVVGEALREASQRAPAPRPMQPYRWGRIVSYLRGARKEIP
ncbi:hypothetical protein G5S34_20135 [Herbaspirillum frisingense]|uniref:hypothetical protein n=1 Tax=Herbaspirillum frisingense TaxID=92645 RepID=UPI0015FFAFF8|nr:hypothetical protein [Herbaspirillum frisingense]QNB08836.1 hypothetical protein G5S34_20135 [Herbaspirillum frisingense]